MRIEPPKRKPFIMPADLDNVESTEPVKPPEPKPQAQAKPPEPKPPEPKPQVQPKPPEPVKPPEAKPQAQPKPKEEPPIPVHKDSQVKVEAPPKAKPEIVPVPKPEKPPFPYSTFTPKPEPNISVKKVKKRFSDKNFRIIVAATIIFLLVVSYFVISHIRASSDASSAKVVGDQFIEYISYENAGPAYQLTDSSYQQSVSQNSLQTMSDYFENNINNLPVYTNNWNVAHTSGQPESVTLKYTVSGKTGSGTIVMTLKKVDGNWLVDSVNFPAAVIQK